MTTVNQNANFTEYPSQEETTLKAELFKTLEKLRSQPLTLWRIILWSLLPKNLSQLETKLEFSQKGKYFWLGLHSGILGQIGICFWPAEIADSRKHGHFYCNALLLNLLGKLTHTQYHVTGNGFFVWKRQQLEPGNLGFIPAWQVHSCRNLSNEWAISLHCYGLLPRPDIKLEVED